MSHYNSKLFVDPHAAYPTELAAQDFPRYIDGCKTLIETHRQDLANNSQAATIIEANSPFELNPAGTPRAGALLLHGLYDSPFIMRELAGHLQINGLKVRSLLLPGHGTVPGALLNTHFQAWVQTVEQGLKGLAQTCDKIWIIGFSTGGTLALNYILKKMQPAIAGMILLAPAIKISPLSALTSLPPRLGLHWYHKDRELDYAKYESFTFNSIHQLQLLINENIQLSTAKLPCPVLMIVSAEDRTISCAGAINYFKQYAAANSQLILYSHQPTAAADRMLVRNATFAALHISGISHVGLPVAPTNTHYGQHGDYVYASRSDAAPNVHYVGDPSLLDVAKNYLHRLGLYPHALKRLSYNPDFDFLKNAVSDFIL